MLKVLSSISNSGKGNKESKLRNSLLNNIETMKIQLSKLVYNNGALAGHCPVSMSNATHALALHIPINTQTHVYISTPTHSHTKNINMYVNTHAQYAYTCACTHIHTMHSNTQIHIPYTYKHK